MERKCFEKCFDKKNYIKTFSQSISQNIFAPFLKLEIVPKRVAHNSGLVNSLICKYWSHAVSSRKMGSKRPFCEWFQRGIVWQCCIIRTGTKITNSVLVTILLKFFCNVCESFFCFYRFSCVKSLPQCNHWFQKFCLGHS